MSRDLEYEDEFDESAKMGEYYMKKRYSSLFETRKLSDCSFIIEDETILSHKIILASSSPVFEAMLYGPMAVSFDIEIRDIPASEFKQMLNFIYTDSVQILSVINAWALVYVAKKYLIEDLIHFCLNYIKQNMNVSNILVNYEFADLFNENTLRNLCLNNVQMYAKVILNSDYHIKPATFCYLLEQDKFNASENDLLGAAIKWAAIECHRKNQDITKNNIRSVLEKSGVLSRIRFLSLPIEEIKCNEVFQKVLHDDEIRVIKSCKINESSENISKLQSLNFSMNYNPRISIEIPQKLGLRTVLKTGRVFQPNAGSKLTTKLVVIKSVLLNGFLLPTRRPPESNHESNTIYNECLNLTITDVANKEVVDFRLKETLKFGSFHTVYIEPFLFDEGKTYNIDISWPELSRNEYCLQYYSPCLNSKYLRLVFNDPFDCGIIQGVFHYAV